MPEPGEGDTSAIDGAYGEACRRAVLSWIRDGWESRAALPGTAIGGLEGFFDGTAERRLVREAVEEGYLPESALAGRTGSDAAS